MHPKQSIHNYSQKLETVRKQVQAAPISDGNKERILEFDRACFLEALSKPRRIKILYSLLVLARDYLKLDFDRATKTDLKEVVMIIDGRADYSPWTKQSYKVILKKFYKWLHYGDEYRTRQDYPKVISWLCCGMKRKDQPRIRASDILTEDEVKQLLDLAEHPRDKAFISMLYELGARIGEIGGVSIGELTRDRYGYIVDLEGKTGHRTPRIVLSDPHLTNWLNMHPSRDDPESALWVMIGDRDKGQHMNYPAFRALVSRLVRRAGIKKRVYPHLFRHTRVTHLLANRQINEAQVKVYFGWMPHSKMLSEYSHLVSSDVNDAILAMHGIKTDNQKESVFRPQQCPRCATINTVDARFCQSCGSALNVNAAFELDEQRQQSDTLMSTLVKDPKVQRLLLQKIVEMGLREKLVEEMG